MESREVIDAEFRVVARGWRFPWRVTLLWLWITGVCAYLAYDEPSLAPVAVFAAAMVWPFVAFAKALAGPLRPAEEAEILREQLSARRAPSRRK